MTREFKSLSDFARHLQKITRNYDNKENKALNIVGKHIKKESQAAIGHLQSGAGPFKTWKELAESTKQDKELKGYVYNSDYNPLLRTGELRDSIDYKVGKGFVSIGSNSEIMIYQELGTIYIPPRSVLGMTMYKNKFKISKSLKEFMICWVEDKNQKAIG